MRQLLFLTAAALFLHFGVLKQNDVEATSISKLRLGVIGYSGTALSNEQISKIKTILGQVYDKMENRFSTSEFEISVVSGLTNIGVPSFAYQEAVKRNKEQKRYRTVGIACELYKKYDCFPVDEKIIVGEKWGDESQTFIDYIDVLVRIGGGPQSIREVEMAKQKGGIEIIEYDV